MNLSLIHISLTAGTLPSGMYFLRVDGVDSILVTPMTYAARDNGMIEYFPGKNGSLKIERTASGFRFSVQVAALTQDVYKRQNEVRAQNFRKAPQLSLCGVTSNIGSL